MMKVNGWSNDEFTKHVEEQEKIYVKRIASKWKLNLDIITNSGYKLIEDL